jgi:tetratricopeptide (TPR) repeat protein
MGSVLLERREGPRALAHLREALRLDPEDADYYAALANFNLTTKDWQDAAELAEQGLAIDPEHIACANIRAMALTNLGRRDDAGATTAAALSRDPNDATSHANMGWTQLHAGEPRRALEHFREALRLEPGSEWARQGIVEAFKARNILYRVMLAYFLWMSRLKNRAQWAVIVGLFLGHQVLVDLKRAHPDWGVVIGPLIVAYLVFVLLSWLASPLFNLVLRLDRLGKHALSDGERRTANRVGGLLAVGLLLLLYGIVAGQKHAVNGAFLLGLVSIPVSVIEPMYGWPRQALVVYTGLLAALGSLLFAPFLIDCWFSLPAPAFTVLKPLIVFAAATFGWVAIGAFFLPAVLSNVKPKR